MTTCPVCGSHKYYLVECVDEDLDIYSGTLTRIEVWDCDECHYWEEVKDNYKIVFVDSEKLSCATDLTE